MLARARGAEVAAVATALASAAGAAVTREKTVGVWQGAVTQQCDAEEPPWAWFASPLSPCSSGHTTGLSTTEAQPRKTQAKTARARRVARGARR
jgi:hypothetical protein